MCEEESETEIFALKEQNRAQARKIDDCEQKMYELKRQLSAAKAMEDHLISEIDSLQNSDKNDNKFLKKISVLEEEINNLKETNSENIQYYESELKNKDAKIDSLKQQPDKVVQENRNEILKYTEEICDLKSQIDELNQNLLEYETKYQEISLKNNALETQINELTIQLNEMKNCLQAKREELEENKELIRNLQDDIFVMQMEIDKYKSLPMEKAAKGNSLFAEVDDNRVKLQKTMETMKKKYMDIRTQYSNKCLELQKLHMEYASVIKVIEDKNDTSLDKYELNKTFERHIEHLNGKIKSLENELEIQKKIHSKLVAKDWKCVQDMVTVAREEVQSLETKLCAESLGLMTSESNHLKTKRELKKWQAEAMQLRAQIVSLTQNIGDLKLLKSPTETQQNSNIKSSNLPTSNWDSKIKNDFSDLKKKLKELQEFNLLENIEVNPDYSIFETLSSRCSENYLKNKSQNIDEEKENISNTTIQIESELSTPNLKNKNLKENISPISNDPNLDKVNYLKGNTNSFLNNISNIEKNLKENSSLKNLKRFSKENKSPIGNISLGILSSRLGNVSFESNISDQEKTAKLGEINKSPVVNKTTETSSSRLEKVSFENTTPDLEKSTEPGEMENVSKENKSPALNATTENFSSKLRKVSFENTIPDLEKSTELGEMGNFPKENKSLALNDTMETLSSRLTKISFENTIPHQQITTKLGGRKIITARPIHIPSIKRT